MSDWSIESLRASSVVILGELAQSCWARYISEEAWKDSWIKHLIKLVNHMGLFRIKNLRANKRSLMQFS